MSVPLPCVCVCVCAPSSPVITLYGVRSSQIAKVRPADCTFRIVPFSILFYSAAAAANTAAATAALLPLLLLRINSPS